MLQLFIVEPAPRLAPLLKRQKDFRVVGSENDPEVVRNRGVACDFMLVSAAFSPQAVIGLISQNQANETPTVIAEIEDHDPLLIPFLEAGAAGYIRKGASQAEITQTLCAIRIGKPPLSVTVGTALVERMHELLALRRGTEPFESSEPELLPLTAREREILELIRNGASNQDIARELTIELGTVKNHVHNILKKLNVSRRDQAALILERTPTPQ
jgi:DNA-binding NarL/FixJ family response regulator